MKISNPSIANTIVNTIDSNLNENIPKVNFFNVLKIIDDLETDDILHIIFCVFDTLKLDITNETQNEIINEIINNIECQYKICLLGERY